MNESLYNLKQRIKIHNRLSAEKEQAETNMYAAYNCVVQHLKAGDILTVINPMTKGRNKAVFIKSKQRCDSIPTVLIVINGFEKIEEYSFHSIVDAYCHETQKTTEFDLLKLAE